MWQNSVIRAYLNGYDIYEELTKGNGNQEFKAKKNYDYKKNSFLDEAFGAEIEEDIMNSNNEDRDFPVFCST